MPRVLKEVTSPRAGFLRVMIAVAKTGPIGDCQASGSRALESSPGYSSWPCPWQFAIQCGTLMGARPRAAGDAPPQGLACGPPLSLLLWQRRGGPAGDRRVYVPFARDAGSGSGTSAGRRPDPGQADFVGSGVSRGVSATSSLATGGLVPRPPAFRRLRTYQGTIPTGRFAV
jgi:hypothetical protein